MDSLARLQGVEYEEDVVVVDGSHYSVQGKLSGRETEDCQVILSDVEELV